MSIAAELIKTRETKASLQAALRSKGQSTTGLVFKDWPPLVGNTAGEGGTLQEKTAIPAATDVTVEPDDGIAGLLKVLIEADINHKPYNIMDGITIHGVTGTAKPYVVPGDSTWPFPDADDEDPESPPTEDAMDEAAQEDDPEVNTEDKMVLVDNNGNITVGYLYTEPDSGLMVYGGAVLPELPETEYPYIVVHRHLFSENQFFVDMLSMRPISNGTHVLVTPAVGTSLQYKRYRYDSDGESVWELVLDETLQGNGINSHYVCSVGYNVEKWANFDILNADGTVYFPKSADPTEYDGFQITWYDPVSTNFKAVGWRRVSKHTTGEDAGTITKDDFTRQESGGWNYLKNIRSCTREKLYYKGVEIWPNMSQTWSYNGVELPALPASKYPYATVFYYNHVGTYWLAFTTLPCYQSSIGLPVFSSEADGVVYVCDPDGKVSSFPDDEWASSTVTIQNIPATSAIWANYDVVNDSDGSVHLDASSPVPV